MSRAKRNPQIDLRKKLLILCEGESEVLYFRLLSMHARFNRKFIVEVEKPRNHSPLGLVTEALDRMTNSRAENAIDHAWCVFDRDGHAEIPKAFALARTRGISIAFSSVCFEYWVMLHFKNSTKHFDDCDGLKGEVVKLHPDYEKANRKVVNELLDRLDVALLNARNIASNGQDETADPWDRLAYTNVHELVDFMLA